MKIKVIDMLVKMGKDKNYKPTFKYKDTIYRYDFKTKYYTPSFMGLYKIYMILNDEVEIIKEPNYYHSNSHKIEKLEVYVEQGSGDYSANILRLSPDGEWEIDVALYTTIGKLNELIDEINNLKEGD